jgi:flavin-dependent dehydrogenase
MKTAIVVGAGISGLSCALDLKERLSGTNLGKRK